MFKIHSLRLHDTIKATIQNLYRPTVWYNHSTTRQILLLASYASKTSRRAINSVNGTLILPARYLVACTLHTIKILWSIHLITPTKTERVTLHAWSTCYATWLINKIRGLSLLRQVLPWPQRNAVWSIQRAWFTEMPSRTYCRLVCLKLT